jgi:uncharacterized membrane protein YphA (DoxX/SURF4 family)
MIPDDSAHGRAWAALFSRLILGFIFFMAGVFKVFQMGALTHAANLFVEPYADTFLPIWSLWLTGAVIPYVELIAGGLLLIGWHTRDALVALGVVLVVVTFGHLIPEPLYAFDRHVIPRWALLVVCLLLRDDDRWSFDSWQRERQGV